MCACNDDVHQPGIEPVIEDEPIPEIDSLKVRTLQRTYVYPFHYKNTGAAVVARVVTKAETLDTTVETVILNDGNVPGLGSNDYRNIALLIARGGNVLYCDATRDGVDTFLRNLKATGLAMLDEGTLRFTEAGYHACRNILHLKEDATGKYVPQFIDNDDTNGILCDIAAIRGNEKCVVADLSENLTVYTVTTDSTDASTGNTSTEEADGIPLEYMYGVHADKVAKWLNDNARDHDAKEKAALLKARSNAQELDIDKYAKAQEEQYSFNVYAGHKFAPVTVTYYVWAVYDDNKKADYYLIHQEVALESSKLKCGPEQAEAWNKYKVAEAFKDVGNDLRAYWAYMNKLSAQVSFNDNNVELSNVSPANNMSGQSSYKESMEWSLSSGFVFSANPHISIDGGVKMSKEWTHDIPDLKLTYQRNKNKPKWEYTAGILPKGWQQYDFGGYPIGWRHDTAKDIMRSDCEMGHSWIWKINNAQNTYSFMTDIQVDLQGLWVEYKNNKGTKKGYKTFTNTNSKTISLMPPPRYEQEWIMRMTPNNREAFACLEKTFMGYWVENFSLYTVEKNDRKAIDCWINDLVEILEKNPQSVKNAGLNKFTLTWKLLKQADDYKSYTYKPTK